jgi:hypothetical protein
MTDWRAQAEIVKERLMRLASREPCNQEFEAALHTFVATNVRGPLDRYLCSDQPLGSQERQLLAAALQPRKMSGGRPRQDGLRWVTSWACAFYMAWREENDARGIGDRGHRQEMRDISARTVTEAVFGPCEGIDIEDYVGKVCTLMDRPMKRRTTAKTR